MSPRVLFVDHTAELGGAELSLLSVAEAFRESCHVVLFDEGPFLDRLRARGIETTSLPAPRFLNGIRREGSISAGIGAVPGMLTLAWRLSQRSRDYDVILANSQKSMIVAALAGLLAQRPVVWYLRDLMSHEHFGLVQRRMASTISRFLVSRTIANSRATQDALIRSGGLDEQITVVHNGIDATPFQTVSESEVEAVRNELDLPSSGVVGVFSRLAEWKGQHILLEALRDLPDVTALLIGDALFPADERYARRLRRDIRTWGLQDQVCMPGFREDVPVLMRACDAVLHTSISPEPFGRVIVEGMLAGRPVIATREGGPGEIITHEVDGLLIPSGDVGALRKMVRRILDHPDEAAALARKGQSRAESAFSVDNMIENVRDVIEDVCSPEQGEHSVGVATSSTRA